MVVQALLETLEVFSKPAADRQRGVCPSKAGFENTFNDREKKTS